MLRMIASTASRTFTGVSLVERSARVTSTRRAATKASASTPAPKPESAVHTKKLLAAAVAAELKMNQGDVEIVLDTTLNTIMQTVAKGEKVQLIGFGTFESRARAARDGRNPSTGEPIKISATTSPAFVAGKKFKDTVKGVVDEKPAAKKSAAKK